MASQQTREPASRARIADGLAFETVLVAAKAQAPWAVQRLYRSLSGPVSGYLRAQRASDPDDLASEVFLRVFRKLSTFDGDQAAFRSWVFTIAHHLVVDERRRVSRRPVIIDLRDHERVQMVGGDAEQDAMASLSGTDSLRLLEALTAEQRTALLLRVVADMTLEQTGEIMGKRPGTVKALQRRAVASLRRQIST
jgi:RNA polymerase sigma factor (sigma-70 family)